MATMMVNGCTIHYEAMGSGPPIVFTSGGRWGRNYHRPLAERMSINYRGIIYDRRNTGDSDVFIAGEATEAEIWADDLAELIRQLGIAPTYLCEYAGCRTTLLLAIRHPELVKALLLGWPASGKEAAKGLGLRIYGQFIEAAEKGGMDAVVNTDWKFTFVEGLAENPSSRDRLLAMDVQEFIHVMRRWHSAFTEGADLSIAGMPATEEQVASIQAPTMIVSGDDDVHTLATAQKLHRLIPNSEHHAPPIPGDEWKKARGTLLAPQLQAQTAAPIFLDFLQRLEARQPATAT